MAYELQLSRQLLLVQTTSHTPDSDSVAYICLSKKQALIHSLTNLMHSLQIARTFSTLTALRIFWPCSTAFWIGFGAHVKRSSWPPPPPPPPPHVEHNKNGSTWHTSLLPFRRRVFGSMVNLWSAERRDLGIFGGVWGWERTEHSIDAKYRRWTISEHALERLYYMTPSKLIVAVHGV